MKRKTNNERDSLGKVHDLKARLEEAEDALRAIRNGEVDSLVIPRPHGDEIFERKGAEYLYRVFLDTMNEGAAALTPEGTVVYCNNRLARILSTSPGRVMGGSIYQFIPSSAAPGFKSAMAKAGRKDAELELRLKRVDETLVPVNIFLNAFRAQDLRAICMVAMDLTERKKAEQELCLSQQQLRALASELSLAEERERRRLAAELHDRIGQTLALAKIRLSSVSKADCHPALGASLGEITDMIDSTIRDTHSLIFEISPPVLYQVGFEAAVEWLADHFREEYGLETVVTTESHPEPLGEDLRVVLFQAIRELLVNIVKHAKASRAKISVKCIRDNLRIVVQDNGLGFSRPRDERQASIGGFGLFHIRERLHHLGAELKIDSSPGKGTKVTLIIPRQITNSAKGRAG